MKWLTMNSLAFKLLLIKRMCIYTPDSLGCLNDSHQVVFINNIHQKLCNNSTFDLCRQKTSGHKLVYTTASTIV